MVIGILIITFSKGTERSTSTDHTPTVDVIFGTSVAMASNILLAGRTVLSKRAALLAPSKGGVRYSEVAFVGALALATPALASGATWEQYLSKANVLGAFLHLCYNEFSYIALSRMSPVGHGIVKVGSRLFIVVVAAYFFKYTTPIESWIGFVVCFMGMLLYIAPGFPRGQTHNGPAEP
jgi:hypothetical protein